jgi:hypothetical protein
MTNSYAFLGRQRDKAKRVRNVIDAAVDNRRQGKNVMRTMFKTAITAALAMVLLGMGFVSKANAQCGASALPKVGSIQLQSWDGGVQFEAASFLRVANQQNVGGGIVGFWKVKFIAEGNAGGPLDGTVIDNGFAQWHSDGTEIMNSSKPPVTSSFCLGVYQKSGPSSYQLNHFALGFDASSNFIGPVQIQESVTVNKKNDQYTGTFTIDQYDPMGNPLGHVAGNITATRVTVDTPVGDVL